MSFSTRMYVSDLMLPTPDGWLTRPRARLGKEEEENNNYARKGDLNTAGARGGVLSTAAVSTGDLNFYIFGGKSFFFLCPLLARRRIAHQSLGARRMFVKKALNGQFFSGKFEVSFIPPLQKAMSNLSDSSPLSLNGKVTPLKKRDRKMDTKVGNCEHFCL